MASFELKITRLNVIQVDSQPNTVCEVAYEYIGTADDGRTHPFLGTHTLQTDDIESFVSFDDLTEATVIEWLENDWWEGHYEHMQDIINQHLDAPIVTSPRAPWEPELIPGVNSP